MQIRKRLRRSVEQSPFALKKDQMGGMMFEMRRKGHSVQEISERYDIPPKVVSRLITEHAKENNPDFGDKEFARILVSSMLEDMIAHQRPLALEEGDQRAYDLLLKTVKEYADTMGVDNAILRQELQEQGVIRHEHSGQIGVGVTYELGQGAAEQLAMFNARRTGEEIEIAENTHVENSNARLYIDEQLDALPQLEEKVVDIEELIDKRA